MPTTYKERQFDHKIKAKQHTGLRAFVRQKMQEGLSIGRIAVALTIATGDNISGPCLTNWLNRWDAEENPAITPAGGN